MPARDVPEVDLKDQLLVRLPNGESYRLRAGPYGKGLAIVPETAADPRPSTGKGSGKRGRKPRASTVKLRAKLERDAGAGKLKDTKAYVAWLLKQDDTVSLAVARQVVYRERRKHV